MHSHSAVSWRQFTCTRDTHILGGGIRIGLSLSERGNHTLHASAGTPTPRPVQWNAVQAPWGP